VLGKAFDFGRLENIQLQIEAAHRLGDKHLRVFFPTSRHALLALEADQRLGELENVLAVCIDPRADGGLQIRLGHSGSLLVRLQAMDTLTMMSICRIQK
jgi:hypothetical protein